MTIYQVTKTSPEFRITNDYNVTEHDSLALLDPKSLIPIGRKIIAAHLTWNEANQIKNDLDRAQGTHPMQQILKAPIAPDGNPEKLISLAPKK